MSTKKQREKAIFQMAVARAVSRTVRDEGALSDLEIEALREGCTEHWGREALARLDTLVDVIYGAVKPCPGAEVDCEICIGQTLSWIADGTEPDPYNDEFEDEAGGVDGEGSDLD